MIRVLFISCSLATLAAAALPSLEVSVDRYQELWEKSVFTSPREVEPTPRANPFANYALGGVSKLTDGYFVVLIDKQNPGKRLVIRPGGERGLKVLRVNWSNQDWKETSVVISDGQSMGSIEFDPSLLQTQVREVTKTPRPRIARTPQ